MISYRAITLGTFKAHSTLKSPKVSKFDVWIISSLILLKYLLRPLVTPKIQNDEFVLPDMSIDTTLRLEQSDFDAFKRAVDDDAMLLPAITTPLVLILFSKVQCPVYPLGAVNTKNKFEYFSSHGRNLSVKAMLGRRGRRVKRGMEVDVTIEVYDEKLVFRQIVTILQFMSSKALPSPPDSKQIEPMDVKWTKTEEMKLSVEDPWRWAAVCKDYNPIHISLLAARMFGFPGQLIHGNHAAALAMSKAGVSGNTEVYFLRPTVIPATVLVRSGDGVTQVTKNGKVLIEIRSI